MNRALPLVTLDKNNKKLSMDKEVLKEILINYQDIRNLPVVVISIAGAFRTGKSFIMNFFLKYMNSTYKSSDGKVTSEWLSGDKSPLGGFKWAGGETRVTTGIQIWPEIWRATLPNGEEVAILLVDTQGLFDHRTTISGNSKIFALSTSIASVQILNISKRIQEDHLEHLELFTKYGAEAAKLGADTNNTPFQKLLFLIRDWSSPNQYNYGMDGGEKYVDRILNAQTKNRNPEEVDESQSSEEDEPSESLKSVRMHVRKCFTHINGFLMPYPGLIVDTDHKFIGELRDIRTEFKDSLLELVPSVLSLEKLVPKVVNGEKLILENLLEYVDHLVTNLNNATSPSSIAEANAALSYRMASDAATRKYEEGMKSVTDQYSRSIADEKLTEKHGQCRLEALKCYEDYKKFGGDTYAKKYLEEIEKHFKQRFELILSINQRKRDVENMRDQQNQTRRVIENMETQLNAFQDQVENLRDINTHQAEDKRREVENLMDIISTQRADREAEHKILQQQIDKQFEVIENLQKVPKKSRVCAIS